LPGTTIVVSPLIALIKDQCDKLTSLGVPSAQVNSSLTEREQRDTIQEIRRRRCEFVFVTPERLATPTFLETLAASPIDLLVIDEAHCISQWGHDFRPSYLGLRDVITTLGKPQVVALTATATKQVIGDIIAQLGIVDMHVIQKGLYRSSLHVL
jgi:ATP-dependent DNA helicase RecQ